MFWTVFLDLADSICLSRGAENVYLRLRLCVSTDEEGGAAQRTTPVFRYTLGL